MWQHASPRVVADEARMSQGVDQKVPNAPRRLSLCLSFGVVAAPARHGSACREFVTLRRQTERTARGSVADARREGLESGKSRSASCRRQRDLATRESVGGDAGSRTLGHQGTVLLISSYEMAPTALSPRAPAPSPFRVRSPRPPCLRDCWHAPSRRCAAASSRADTRRLRCG